MPQAKHLKGFTLKREKLYRQVADLLQGSIMSGELNAGDRLPSERDLAEQLGVSRTVIRDALRLLEERGLITTSIGDGTYISESIRLYVKQKQTSYRHLAQVRHMIEVETTGLAARNATPEDIEKIEETVRELEQNISHVEDFVRADIRFHSLLAEASQNPLLPMLLVPISEPLHDLSSRASSLPGAQQDALRHHRNILSCIKKHDVQAARRAMRDHLDSSARWGDLAAQQIPGDEPEE